MASKKRQKLTRRRSNSKLFCNDGKRMKFWMDNCAIKEEVKRLIEENGGVMLSRVTKGDTETIRLEKNDAKRKTFKEKRYVVSLIYDSVEKKRLQDVGSYQCKSTGSYEHQSSSRRKRAENYTQAEDEHIVRYLVQHAGDKLRDTVTGKDGVVRPKHSLRDDFQCIQDTLLPHRTVDSIRERYCSIRQRVRRELDKPTALPVLSVNRDEIESMSDDDDSSKDMEDAQDQAMAPGTGEARLGVVPSSSPVVPHPGRRTRYTVPVLPTTDEDAAIVTGDCRMHASGDDDDDELDSQINRAAVRAKSTEEAKGPPQSAAGAAGATGTANTMRRTRGAAAKERDDTVPQRNTQESGRTQRKHTSDDALVPLRASKRLKQATQGSPATVHPRGNGATSATATHAEVMHCKRSTNGSTTPTHNADIAQNGTTAAAAASAEESAVRFETNSERLRRAIGWMATTTRATAVDVFRTLYQHSGSVDKTMQTLQDETGNAPKGCASAHDALLSQGSDAIKQHIKLYGARLSAERTAFLNHVPPSQDD
eukprot:m.1006880 g.1006880  ORF g.1006880 m.1006880 type:complete len:537 (-) comp24056_c1_seq20:1915-3525(-)